MVVVGVFPCWCVCLVNQMYESFLVCVCLYISFVCVLLVRLKMIEDSFKVQHKVIV